MPVSATSAVSAPTVFLSPAGSLTARGDVCRLTVATPALPASLASRLSSPGGASLAFAAVPFDPSFDAVVIHPEQVDRAVPTGALDPVPGVAGSGARVVSTVTREAFAAAVREALARLDAEAVRKVVLSRHLALEFDGAIDVARLVARLHRDQAATTFCLPLDPEDPRRLLVGASPELLIEKEGARITSAPLAGSAPRVGAPELDRHAAEALARSEKDGREHAIVVEWIADRLAPYCRTLTVPSRPSLAGTRSMWHLASCIDGTLRDATTPSAELALALHPTPAVGGVPHAAALRMIAGLEAVPRRFYAGAVGWTNARGDGRWMVAIRCVEIEGAVARLHAGAGIVAGSEPDAEAAETSAKLTTVLSALGVDERGLALAEDR